MSVTGAIYYNLSIEGDEKINTQNFIGKKLEVMIQYNMGGENTFKYHKIGEINIKAEKDYDIDDIKGEVGYSKRITIEKMNDLAELFSRHGVLYGNTSHATPDDVIWVLIKLTDDEEANGEMIKLIMYDIRTNSANYQMSRGPPAKGFVFTDKNDDNPEKNINDLLTIYGIQK